MHRLLLPALLITLAGCAAAHGADNNPIVAMETSMGTIKIELFADKAPATVKNFLSYVDKKHYDETIFHRVMPGFVIQGGGFTAGMRQEKETGAPIRNESDNGLSNQRGTLSMARTSDPDSATAQFYINLKDNTALDGGGRKGRAGYCVFGKVIQGMDIVDKIAEVRTGNRGPHQNVPVEDVFIKSVRRSEK